jgi:hypothetical protein
VVDTTTRLSNSIATDYKKVNDLSGVVDEFIFFVK